MVKTQCYYIINEEGEECLEKTELSELKKALFNNITHVQITKDRIHFNIRESRETLKSEIFCCGPDRIRFLLYNEENLKLIRDCCRGKENNQ